MIDAADCGNPVHEMVTDATIAAAQIEFYAGLVTEMKGASIPMGPGVVNFSVREPRGVVGRIIPFNHPFMFCAGKAGAPLATGNTVIMKPPEQAPLSALRLAELIGGLLPPGVFNVVPGGREAGSALTTHPDVAMIALIGSVPTGRAVMKAAADTLKPVMLELGGKNALIAYPDADPDEVAGGVVGGMNFTWCGQSCGSTSRAFIHEKIYDAVLAKVKTKIAHFKPGIADRPLDHHGRDHFQERSTSASSASSSPPSRKAPGFSPAAAGPPIRRWPRAFSSSQPCSPTYSPTCASRARRFSARCCRSSNGATRPRCSQEVNAVEYGLTASIWTNDLSTAHRTAATVQAGFVWINEVSKHFLGAPFGGYKQSGIGREECFEEMLAYTQEKNIHLKLRPANA